MDKKKEKLVRAIAAREGSTGFLDLSYESGSTNGSSTNDCDKGLRAPLLCLLNVGNESGAGDCAIIERVLRSPAGGGDEFVKLHVARGKSYSFAVFASTRAAARALALLDGARIRVATAAAAGVDSARTTDSGAAGDELDIDRLEISTLDCGDSSDGRGDSGFYAAADRGRAPAKSTRAVHALPALHVPFPAADTLCAPAAVRRRIRGLHVVHDFVTPAEERALLAAAAAAPDPRAPWRRVAGRLVQHHGFVFDYASNHVDFARPAAPLPAWCDFLLARMDHVVRVLAAEFPRDYFSYKGFNQLTLNSYPAGEGISPHVDTHTRFDSPITSLSLISGVQMEFRTLYYKNSGDDSDDDDSDDEKSVGSTGCKMAQKKYKTAQVWLPARSVAFMAGRARLAWEHGIRARTADVVDGVRFERRHRVSMTFRGVRGARAGDCVCCSCGYDLVCDARIAGGAAPDRLKAGAAVNRHGVPVVGVAGGGGGAGKD